jgi:heme/copper-type cytochrome/quinol oxidase subunit 2
MKKYSAIMNTTTVKGITWTIIQIIIAILLLIPSFASPTPIGTDTMPLLGGSGKTAPNKVKDDSRSTPRKVNHRQHKSCVDSR